MTYLEDVVGICGMVDDAIKTAGESEKFSLDANINKVSMGYMARRGDSFWKVMADGYSWMRSANLKELPVNLTDNDSYVVGVFYEVSENFGFDDFNNALSELYENPPGTGDKAFGDYVVNPIFSAIGSNFKWVIEKDTKIESETGKPVFGLGACDFGGKRYVFLFGQNFQTTKEPAITVATLLDNYNVGK